MSEKSLETIFSQAQNGSLQSKCELLCYGKSKGFQNTINRKLIWPFLLGINRSQLKENIYDWADVSDRNCQDYEQIQRDTDRSLSNMQTFKDISKFHLQKRQKDVLNVLNHFFYKNKELRYTQGFHDVASVLTILFGNSMGYCMLQKAGQFYFKDSLTKDLAQMNLTLKNIIFEILFKQEKSFKQIFACYSPTTMISFIIPWILTWFSHVFDNMKTICRIWDYLLCSGPHGIIYLTTAIILSTKQKLKSFKYEYDLASIHNFFQKLVQNQRINIQQSINLAINLEDSYPIPTLKAYQQIQKDSVFNTEVFELNIDLHRQVREHLKIQKQKKVLLGKVVFAAGAIVAGLVLIQRFRKKIV